MNEFGFIDYKKPTDGMHDDFRTSTYRGHVHMTDTAMGNETIAKFKEHKAYEEDPVLEGARVSDYKANFQWQYNDPGEIRNPTLKSMQSMKDLEDIKLRIVKRPIKPACSVMREDFSGRPSTEPPLPPPIALNLPVKTTPIVIDRSKQGFAKYLDPASTTSRLAFVHYTPDHIMGGIAADDYITFWNWPKLSAPIKPVFPTRDVNMCDDKPSQQCTKRRCEFASQLKHVPNSGLTTEVRENYLEPRIRKIETNNVDIRNSLVHLPEIPLAKKTEYNLYGSGEPTQKYV